MFRSRRAEVRGFRSQRSLVIARTGMVCASQPLAAEAGLHILRAGGTAVDAAIAALAMLAVVEPYNTGLGGDCFALLWYGPEQRLYGLNGSGRAPQALTIEALRAAGHAVMPLIGPWSITVPGAVQAWHDLHERFGRLAWAKLFEPALAYAEEGYAVSEIIAHEWGLIVGFGILQDPRARQVFTMDGRAPGLGEVMRLPALARTLRELASGGADWFYRGDFAARIAASVQAAGGVLAREDLAAHRSTWVEPLCTEYRGVTVAELPPNGQGLAALIGLNILENFDLPGYGPEAVESHHYRIEATKLALADRNRYVADPEHALVPTAALLSKDYAQGRAALLSSRRALADVHAGLVPVGRDTVYLTAADSEGTVVSIINSLFFPFGSGVAVEDTGVVLHNRGAGFVLDPSHPNCVAPRKRPLHTLIPAMLLQDGKPLVSFGVMGGDHQAQAHLQVVSNLVDFGFNVQEALDFPRFHCLDRNRVAVEEDFPAPIVEELRQRGHWLVDPAEVRVRGGFGGGQAIAVHPLTGAYWGGSDRRKDGQAIGY